MKHWVRIIAGVVVLWSSTAWSATLTWNANSEPDLAGYRVYQCSQLPCTRTSGRASLLATLERVTGFNIGTPAQIQYYFITAYDSAKNESGASNLATLIPAGSPPPPPTPGGLHIDSVS
jgi:endoglucanase